MRAELIELAAKPDPHLLLERIAERKRVTESRLPAERILEHLDAGRR